MVAFRVFLGTLLAVITIYTLAVVAEHGLNLFAVFFGDIGALGWPGQFNLDFLGMLMLSALWTAWRNEFSPKGLVLGLLALLFGAPFLAIYLLVLSVQSQGNLKEMLLGEARAG